MESIFNRVVQRKAVVVVVVVWMLQPPTPTTFQSRMTVLLVWDSKEIVSGFDEMESSKKELSEESDV